MDADGNEFVSRQELADYRLRHPDKLSSTKSTTTIKPKDIDGASLAWAEKQVAKYDKNKDGQLSVSEAESMIVKPPAGADANGDGQISPEEFAKARQRR